MKRASIKRNCDGQGRNKEEREKQFHPIVDREILPR
ncbi:hypothetical protein EUBDOL_00160 [Amedibacillus dolichus DSM 3991]|uniref:Uncharacterized protein n=1 Tax=Amedibacillus dolichus DSM 3991 TaxID=428127 RepID=A8R827_9FIRM|nr:hypothetical protein EUBDOL_00160 [Amedibacillus dolichus DSM 3991]